ncbi:enoyl-CoA hydratase/isomerase family protein [Ammoniphilus resinae]|uniref:Enoyl-CoA hydratase/carnithine racemase n=1 Tax=Ammoniphilus resinae TaxID=861532 RepID=A0ABS4GLF1_9BACL|nr:enoyl-CoA hydratase-related protein [Ammoniphilus resinae]MBP1930937.1 enoyl-CoA hydratase/carnithine racemase [Ammoniphilus resinae]
MNFVHLKTLKVENIEQIAVISLSQPEKLNILTGECFEEMNVVLTALKNNNQIKVLVITGAGEKAFCAGSDVRELADLEPVEAYERMQLGHKMNLRIHEFPKPIIAMVNGYALGGGFELALACDLIMASEKAKFGFPEISLNTFPGWGGTQMAVKKMGLNRAKEFILTGHYYSAKECSDFGFINQIVSPENLFEETMRIAQAMASKESYCLTFAKDCINRADELDLANGFNYEAQAYAVNFSMEHRKVGFTNFLNRKK